jgi:deazaflavin-dependent oxidoreductase (nitroreductase family)
MTDHHMEQYLHNDSSKRDELTALPDQVVAALAAHLELYKIDPVKAHIWDPIVIGVPWGPCKNLMLTHIGNKSGKLLQAVLQYYELDGNVAVVASRGGTVGHPAWYLNLVANPNCLVQIAGFSSSAKARTATAAERARWWPLICAEQPEQAKYEKRTSRQIPVVVLETDKAWQPIVEAPARGAGSSP